MNTWRQRLAAIMQEKNITCKMLAQRMELSEGAVYHYLKGVRAPSLEKLEELAAATGVSLSFLQFGVQVTPDGLVEVPFSSQGIPRLEWRDLNAAESKDDIIVLIEAAKRKGDIIEMSLNDDVILGKNVAAVQVENDAMQHSIPHRFSIFEGDYLVIDYDNCTPQSGAVVMANTGNAKILRQYIEEGTNKFLRAFNPQFPLIYDFKIIGTVINIIKKLPF